MITNSQYFVRTWTEVCPCIFSLKKLLLFPAAILAFDRHWLLFRRHEWNILIKKGNFPIWIEKKIHSFVKIPKTIPYLIIYINNITTELCFFQIFSAGKVNINENHYHPFRMTPYLIKIQGAEDQLCCVLLAEKVHSGYEGNNTVFFSFQSKKGHSILQKPFIFWGGYLW